jgi:hypothetical protein
MAEPYRPLPSPGWYPDPTAPWTVRWWDGRSWTPYSTHAAPHLRREKKRLSIRSGLRKAAVIGGWVLAAFSFLCGVAAIWHVATFPSALARHPVRTDARVVDSFINGFGGDPAVDYRYTVNGHTYQGWGTGTLGKEDPLSLKPGDSVAIDYAKTEPWKSCTCDAKGDGPGVSDLVLGIGFLLPLPYLVVRRVRRYRRTARQLEVPAPT